MINLNVEATCKRLSSPSVVSEIGRLKSLLNLKMEAMYSSET
jgi:hypothetical protein